MTLGPPYRRLDDEFGVLQDVGPYTTSATNALGAEVTFGTNLSSQRRTPIAKRQKRIDADFRGDLQADVMAAIWKLGASKVEDVRRALPGRHTPAYTTVQTVMNRLAERGLLRRKRVANAFVYEAPYDEADLLTRSIGNRLAVATPEARRAAVLSIIDNLDSEELGEVARIAAKVRKGRKRG